MRLDSAFDKLLVACNALLYDRDIIVSDGQPSRISLAHIPVGASKTQHEFIERVVTPRAPMITDDLLRYENPLVIAVDGRTLVDPRMWLN